MVVLWSFNNFSMSLLSSSQKSPSRCWSSCSTTLHSGIDFFKEAMISPSYFMKTSTTTNQCSLDFTLWWHNRQILSSRDIRAYLSTSISNWCEEVHNCWITLPNRLDKCIPKEKDLLIKHSLMCVKNVGHLPTKRCVGLKMA